MPVNLVFCVSLFGFSVAALIPLETTILPEDDLGIPLDKVFHILGFAWLTYFALRIYSEKVSLIIVGLILYGFLIEILQSISGWRTAEGADVMANIIGILFGYCLRNWISKTPKSCRSGSK